MGVRDLVSGMRIDLFVRGLRGLRLTNEGLWVEAGTSLA